MSKNEIELRRQAELRLWEDRIEALKQANLLPEWTAPVVQLIQEKMQQLREEKPKELENLPEPVVTESSSAIQPEEPKVTMAQQVQRDDPAPKKDTIQDFLADLEAPAIEPSASPKPVEAVSFSTPDTAPVSFEPVPEPNAAIPTAADKGTEPLSFEPPAPMKLPETPVAQMPLDNQEFEKLVSTTENQTKSVDSEEPIKSGRKVFNLPQTNAAPPLDKPEPPPRESPFPKEPEDTADFKMPEMPVSTKQPSASSAADVLDGVRGSSGIGDAVKPIEKLASKPIQKTQEDYLSNLKKGDKDVKPSDRRDKALKSKPQVPPGAMSPDLLERWKNLQAQRAQPDDGRDQIGGRMPSVAPGGTKDDVHSMQSLLTSEADMALSQAGQLFERFANAFKILSLHIKEANRILDEGGF